MDSVGVPTQDPERSRLFPAQNSPLLHVDDVAATRAELEEKGIEFVGPTMDTGVCHMALFSDPDGNDLALHHRYAPYPDASSS